MTIICPAFTLMVKLPSKSVMVAFLASALSLTVAPITASPFSSITVPLIPWAKDVADTNSAINIIRILLFFIEF